MSASNWTPQPRLNVDTPVGLTYVTVIITIVCLWFTVTTYLFWQKRHTDVISRRMPIVLLVASIVHTGLFIMFMLNLNVTNAYNSTLCVVQYSLYYLLCPIWLFIYVIRTFHLIFTFAVQQARLAVSRRQQGTEREKGQKTVEPTVPTYLVRFVFAFFSLLSTNKRKGKSQSVSDLTKDGENSTISQYGNLQVSQVLRGIALFLLFAIILALLYGAFAINPLYLFGDIYCAPVVYYPLYGFIGIFMIILPGLIRSIRHVPDPLGMRRELVVSMSFFYPTFILYLIQAVPKIIIVPAPVGGTIWLAFLQLTNHSMHILWPLYLLHKAEKEREKLGLDHASFDKMLCDPKLFTEFKQSVVKELCVENVLFVEDYWILQEIAGIRHTGFNGHELTNQTSMVSRVASKRQGVTMASSTGATQSVVAPNISLAPRAINESLLHSGPHPKNGSSMAPVMESSAGVFNASHSRDVSVTQSSTNQTGSAVATVAQLTRQLFDNYIAAGSLYELNLPAKMVAKCKEAMNAATSPDPTIFEEIYQAVLYMLFSNSYPRYIASRGSKQGNSNNNASVGNSSNAV